MTVSVVVPTYNRLAQLRRTLEALATQTGLDDELEVIVVSDGSTDGTDDYLRSGGAPLPVTAVTQPNSGPATARNHGVDVARGDLVLFVDDDVVPMPDLVAAHVRRHAGSADDLVVIGPMTAPLAAKISPWVQWQQDMLDKQYSAMRRGDHAATARQFYTGNASISRRLLVESGGFDPNFRRAEDVELAYRLATRGARFVFAPEAVVSHDAERSFDAWLATSYDDGRNDVIFARDKGQQWLLDAIGREFHGRHRLVRSLTRVTLPRPRLARAATIGIGVVAKAAAALRIGAVTAPALSAVYNLSYYRGMADELVDPRSLLRRFDDAASDPARPLRVGFVLEQTLGHITHTSNLRRLVGSDTAIEAVFEEVPYDVAGVPARMPGYGNWTVRAGLRARAAIRRMRRAGPLDALFIHTQVPAIASPDHLRRTPTVVSLDATPIQYDELGAHYDHQTGSERIEDLKWRANRACFARAAAIVTWAEWTKAGLVDRYEVPAAKIVVIPPGVDYERWAAIGDGGDAHDGTSVRVLFVGGDFERKGGLVLLDALREVRSSGSDVQLDIVTRDDVADAEGVRIHHGLGPNDPELIRLYHQADVFCLPTLGDCLPMVLSEAGAVGLPLVSTDVGAISEIVRHDCTGLLVPVGDPAALADALRRLATEPDLRRRLGDEARRVVRAEFDAATNARRLVALLVDVAHGRAPA